MINPFDYLFYKIYTAWSHLYFSRVPYTHTLIMTLLLALNVLTGYLFIEREWPSDNFMIISYVTIVVFTLPYLHPRKESRIIAKFENESGRSRTIGNTVVISYVILSIISFVLVMKMFSN